MNSCEKCGKEFEGYICPECDTVIANVSSENFSEEYYKRLAAGDISGAVRHLGAAGASGYVWAQVTIAKCYLNGTVLPQDIEKACMWFEKAAMQGDSEAQYVIAVAYETGEGVEQDLDKAKMWFEKAAMQGETLAMQELGMIFEKEKNDKKALYWYEKAAENGDAISMVLASNYYVDGIGVKKDSKKAVQLLRKAIATEKIPNNIHDKVLQSLGQALSELGIDYAEGNGVERHIEMAYKCFREGIELGSEDAVNNLGVLETRKRQGKCLYCGGNFKGLFNKCCSNCGIPKNY